MIENLIDDERRRNAFGLMMSLNMLIEFGDAFDFTGRDFDGWCREDRFSSDRSDSTTRPRKCSRSVQIVNAAGRTPENRCRVRAKRDRVLKINPRTCIDFQWQLLAGSN